MSINYEFDRRIVVTTSILLIALWLSLTAFAADLPQPGELPLVVDFRADDCPHCQRAGDYLEPRDCKQASEIPPLLDDTNGQVRKDGIGFSETDPAIQAIHNAPASVSKHSQKAYAGFSETDPVDLKPPVVVHLGKTPDKGSLPAYAYAGFSETTPVANIDPSVEEIHHRAFVKCHDRGASETGLGTPKISALSEKDEHHERS